MLGPSSLKKKTEIIQTSQHYKLNTYHLLTLFVPLWTILVNFVKHKCTKYWRVPEPDVASRIELSCICLSSRGDGNVNTLVQTNVSTFSVILNEISQWIYTILCMCYVIIYNLT